MYELTIVLDNFFDGDEHSGVEDFVDLHGGFMGILEFCRVLFGDVLWNVCLLKGFHVFETFLEIIVDVTDEAAV